MRQRCRPLYVMHTASQHGVTGQKISICEYRSEKLKSLLRRLFTLLVHIVWLVNCLLDWLVSQSTVAAMNRFGESCSNVTHRICYGGTLFFTAHFRGWDEIMAPAQCKRCSCQVDYKSSRRSCDNDLCYITSRITIHWQVLEYKIAHCNVNICLRRHIIFLKFVE